MAGESDLLNKLARSLASVDDAALAAIASAGLVRRAHKDLEKESITVESADDAVRVNVGGEVVTMTAAGPAMARCSCPAGAKCRHILIATLYLKRQQPDEASTPPDATSARSARDELLGYTWDMLSKWVGRKALREASDLVDASPDAEIDESGALTIRFPAARVDCRYFPGAGLDGMVTTAPSKSRERFLAAAVLAYQRRHGVTHQDDRPAPPRAPADSGAPRTRAEVLGEARSLLEEMVAVGIAHASAAARDRLQTLGVSCIGAGLPRLSMALRAIADEVGLTLRRDARADDGRFLAMLARTNALVEAIGAAGDSAPASLVGRHRSRYDETGTLALGGAGAYAWRTQSGYRGLTVLFWDAEARRWCSWSDSRTRDRDPSFDPVARYEQDLPWPGASTARRMSRARLNLQGASRNDEDRLSASQQCRALLLGEVDPTAIEWGDRLFDDWSKLQRHLASVTPAGLEQHAPLERVVVVRPHAWGPRVFLPVEQTLTWTLMDENARPLVLTLPFDEVNARAIDALDRIDPDVDRPWGVLGRISTDGAVLRLWPYAIYRDSGPAEGRIQNLNLDAAIGGQPSASRTAPPPAHTPGPEDDSSSLTGSLAAMLRHPTGLEEELQRLAEMGTRSLGVEARERFSSLARDLRDRGLAPLADVLEPLASSRNPAAILLRAKYVCMLCRELGERLAVGVEDPTSPLTAAARP